MGFSSPSVTAESGIWVDGQLVFQISNPAPHSLIQTGMAYRARVRRAYFLPETGLTDLTALVSPASGPTNDDYRSTSLNIVGANSPYIQPTVPSGQFLFPRIISSMFNADPTSVENDGFLATLKNDGVTHLECGAWAANASWTTLAQWQSGQDSLVKPNIQKAINNGYRIVLLGDNIMRTQALRDLYYNASYRQQATQSAGQYFHDTGVCDSIQMVDEIGPDPAEYGDVTLFVNDWRSVHGPLISWPNQSPTAWENDTYSDHYSRYQATQEARNGRPGKVASFWQNKTASNKRDLNPAPPTSHFYIGSVACVGEFYLKYVPGDHYQSGDVLNAGITRPQAVIAQIYMLMSDGASGWRMYAYDFAQWRNGRANGLTNGSVQQTGCYPGDTERWPGCRAAMTSVISRQSLFLQTPYVATTSGPWVFGRRGNFYWGVNTSEHSLSSPNGPGVIVTPNGEYTSSTVPAGGVILWIPSGGPNDPIPNFE